MRGGVVSVDERWAAIDAEADHRSDDTAADWPGQDVLFDNADGEYPPDSFGGHMVKVNKVWRLVETGPAIDDYQPATVRAGQPEEKE